MITGTQTDGQWSLEASRFTDDTKVELTSDRVVVAYYQESVESLGLAPGKVGPVTTPRSCALTEPLGTFELDLDQGSWRATEDVLTESLVPDGATRCLPCAGFKVTRVSLDTLDLDKLPYASIRASAAVDHRVILAPGYGGLLLVSPESSRPITGCPTKYVGLLLQSPTELWATTSTGSLDHAELDLGAGTCRVTETFPGTGEAVFRSTGGFRGEEPEVYLSTLKPGLTRFYQGRFEPIVEVEGGDPYEGLALWLGPGRVDFVARTHELVSYEEPDSRVTSFERFLTFEEQLASLAMTETFGEIIVTDRGALIRRVGADWVSWTTQVREKSGSILTFRDGLLAVQGSTVIQFRAGWRECEAVPVIGAIGSGQRAVEAGGRFLLPDEIRPDQSEPDVRQHFEGIWLTPE